MLQVYGSKWESIRIGNQEADKLTQESKVIISWPWTFGPKYKRWAIKRNDDIASTNKSKFSKESYKHATYLVTYYLKTSNVLKFQFVKCRLCKTHST